MADAEAVERELAAVRLELEELRRRLAALEGRGSAESYTAEEQAQMREVVRRRAGG